MPDECVLVAPEGLWPVDVEYRELYDSKVARGRDVADRSHAIIVAIARNAMPYLPNTLELLRQAQESFAYCDMFVFENDSTDGTQGCLDAFAKKHDWFEVLHDTWGGLDSRGFERARTERLAKARNICFDRVKSRGLGTHYTIVVDLDPHRGFSVDGVFNSIGWMSSPDNLVGRLPPGAMASYSLLYRKVDDEGQIAHYDSWAARQNFWRDRRNEDGGMSWASLLLPPVGSPPIPMNSAFGGLCVYDTDAFLSGGYSGEDCEHVSHHRRMHDAGWQLYLNPGCRYIAHWQ